MAEVEATSPAAHSSSDRSSNDAGTGPILNGTIHKDTVNVTRPLSPRKRRRSSKPTTTRETRALPAAVTTKATQPLLASPVPFTGTSAIADERRKRTEGLGISEQEISPNQAQKTLQSLTAVGSQLSRPTDAPTTSASPDRPTADVVPSMTTASRVENHGGQNTSPQSDSSNVTLKRMPTAMSVSNGDAVASPGQLDDASGEDEESPRSSNREHDRESSSNQDDGRSNKAFTFPGPMGGHPHRTSSLPQSGYGRENTSPSAKRHKCPYCNTDFTRHHNLKSHLLTHSQEKPFSCDKCESRFRRLHDLKRHAKLHTGERPHVCPKCDRSFARGDALARHNKGQGGCAGRRESMGSFGGDDRQDESMRSADGDGMPGMLYTSEPSHEPEHMDEDTDTPAGRSLPSIRKHEAPTEPPPQLSEHQNLFHARQPSTYPPVAARPSAAANQLYPPPQVTSPRIGSGSSTAQSSLNQYPPPPSTSSMYQSSTSSVFAPGGMTESPKPLSPGGANAHQLGHGSVHSANNSASSHGTGQHGSIDRNNPFGGQQDRLWAVVDSLASKVNRLEEEVAMLKGKSNTQPTQRGGHTSHTGSAV
ncbi:uncharacterized protein KY384_009062 [Bacidia gigantensis]|uniref:uncharacterized protein n=1 Tax=Bacidia gigantensis TaxID=2732470 RepID=UPI001D040E66|nr:uncharacterized protein KY384_009062 [Bacidia gigantensis]KAG8525418.1 hypothetical protein KY384_009062 [Bacidia gigantensis]